MTPYIVTARALEIASIYWLLPWWELSADDIAEALDWWNEA